MGYSSVRGGELEGAYRRLESAQYFLFIINIVMLLVGLANFSVCMWIRWATVAVCSCNFPPPKNDLVFTTTNIGVNPSGSPDR